MGKGIFIGLGGAGVNTTGHLKAKILFDHYGGNEAKMNLDCRFIFIDTDDKDINALNELYSKRVGGGRDFISDDERVNLGNVNPFALHWDALHPVGNRTREQERLLSWIDPEAAKKLKHQPLSDGASANRQQGRTAVWSRWRSIEGRIRTAVNALSDIGKREGGGKRALPTINLLSGTCGGTGSSMLLDVAFMVDRMWRDKNPGEEGDPIMRAVLFMPYQYIENYRISQSSEVTIEDYQCNGFALFDELEAVLADKHIAGDGTKFKEVAAGHVDYKGRDMPFPVFNFAFCIDARTEGGHNIKQEEIYLNTAELLYYWHLGAATQGAVVSRVDNEQQAIGDLRPGDSVPLFSTIGYRALRFPEELMEEYFTTRFLYELFAKGLLGDDYEAVVPDERRRQEHVQQAFKTCIARYLFADKQQQGVPNLERDRLDKVENKLQLFGSGRFKREGKDAIDPNRVADPDLLGEFVADAADLARQIKEEMKREFDNAGPTSIGSLVRMMRDGFTDATGRTGSLEDEIEDAILRYGLKYARQFAINLDTMCDAQVYLPGSDNDLLDKKEAYERRLIELEGEIEAARRKCQEVRSGKREEAFWGLHGHLLEQIERRSTIVILEQQIEVLYRLFKGEEGILDDYKHGIADLITKASDDVNNKEKGLFFAYQGLPKRFSEMGKNVTTSYLPPIETFVDQEGWTRDHLFATLYRKLVEQEHVGGGDERPRRYGLDFGYNPAKQGLHGVLWEMLTDQRYTGRQRGYDDQGHTRFFRKAFAKSPPDKESRELLEEFRNIAVRYINVRAQEQEDISQQRNKSLLERFRALDDKEKSKIIKDFDDRGTQTFCRMEGVGGPIYSVYAGPDLGLVLELKPTFENRGNEQFVEESSRNRLVKIKVVTQQTLRRYPHYRDLQSTYWTVKEMRERDGRLFAPHIHRIFNKVGAQRGLAQVALDSPDKRIRLFATTLLYREILDKAAEENRFLLEQILDLNPMLVGQEKRQNSPLIIQKGADGSRLARICHKFERTATGKLQLLEKNFITVCHNALNLYEVFNSMADYTTVFAALSDFDDFFRRHTTSVWIPLLEKGRAGLKAKVVQGLTVGDPKVRLLYEKLSNDLEENIYPQLTKTLSERTPNDKTPEIGGTTKTETVKLDV
ncbi:MAG TPA: tubulin-like doman-containing protein [Pyrinomonadaceae bacterium]|nr:tubulin-like doman-containing protein [Pyrinomonadaceae bacterium]